MPDYYYAPFQYELREQLPSTPKRAKATISLSRSVGISPGVIAGSLAGGYFLAYTPLFQPSPPAKTPDLFQIYNLGGYVV